eukprot:288594_1
MDSDSHVTMITLISIICLCVLGVHGSAQQCMEITNETILMDIHHSIFTSDLQQLQQISATSLDRGCHAQLYEIEIDDTVEQYFNDSNYFDGTQSVIKVDDVFSYERYNRYETGCVIEVAANEKLESDSGYKQGSYGYYANYSDGNAYDIPVIKIIIIKRKQVKNGLRALWNYEDGTGPTVGWVISDVVFSWIFNWSICLVCIAVEVIECIAVVAVVGFAVYTCTVIVPWVMRSIVCSVGLPIIIVTAVANGIGNIDDNDEDDNTDQSAGPSVCPQIFVDAQPQPSVTIHFDPKMTISEIKHHIYSARDIVPEEQRLIFAARELEDCRTLEFYDIHAENTLQLKMRLPGGAHWSHKNHLS